MSWRTRILGLVAVLVGLVLAGALALRWALAPERLEAAVEQAFAEATGLPLELAEPPALRLLPRFGLDLGPGQVAGGPEAGAEPLLAWRSVRIDASAASALRGRPELGRVEADGLHLRLRRDAAGRGNWEPALARLRQRAAAGGAGDAGSLRIAGLELTNARIDYRDARDPAAALALTGLALRAGAWSPGGTVAVEGSFVVERTARRLAVLSRAALRVGDAGDAGWRVDSLVLRGRALLPARELPFELDVPRLDVDPRGARATAAAATLGAGPARVTASALSVEWPERAPLRASGRVSLAPVAPRLASPSRARAIPPCWRAQRPRRALPGTARCCGSIRCPCRWTTPRSPAGWRGGACSSSRCAATRSTSTVTASRRIPAPSLSCSPARPSRPGRRAARWSSSARASRASSSRA
jgi:hypothetical protein